jgi:hypothetical protein
VSASSSSSARACTPTAHRPHLMLRAAARRAGCTVLPSACVRPRAPQARTQPRSTS